MLSLRTQGSAGHWTDGHNGRYGHRADADVGVIGTAKDGVGNAMTLISQVASIQFFDHRAESGDRRMTETAG